MKQVLGVVVVVLLFGSLGSCAPAKKQLAGPPSEFSLHTLPNTTVGHLTSEYNSHFIYFKNSSDVMSWEADLTVDSTTNFAFFISTPHAKSVTVTLTNEKSGKKIPLPTPLEENFPIGMELVPTSSYRFGDTLPIGIYTLEIVGAVADIAPAQNPLEADGLVIAYNESPYKIYSNLISYRLQKGEKVGIRAMIYNSLLSSPQGDVAPRPVLMASAVAELEIELPNGTDVTVDMHDDGLHDDLMADDGIYGATIVAPQAGRYIAEPKLLAQPKKGGPVLRRSTLQLFNVVDLPFSVTPTATGILSGDNKMKIYVPVGEEVDKTLSYRPYAEVWGKSVTGADVAVCWISTLSPITDFGGAPNLELELDLNWVKMANAKEPLTLKNFYVQELSYFTPLVEGQTIAIKTKESIHPLVDQLVVTGITKEMRQGKAPIRATNSTKEKGKLVLVHGYCAERNPWQQSPEDWTNPAYFLNPKASISNDEFAKKVADFAENFESFSYLGHSQGGMVGVHLHNFYFTGLENSQGGRTVQSLGTPYKGNTVAGVGASLAGIFGVACGSNDDLTKDGAELWLKGITTETRKDVYYYTTTYPNSGAKYCVWALNLLLQKPNDGTSELALTALDGATNLGSTPGWCHTEGMKYTPQYYDHERNKAINAAAAR